MRGATMTGELTSEVEVLVRLSAAIGAGRSDERESAFRDALEHSRAAVEEALLQSHLFAGYPAAIAALGRWRALAGASGAEAGLEEGVDWAERGAAVCERVYGGQYGRLRANVAYLHPELERWMVRDGYGKVLGRPGLALAARELCVVALLCAQDAEPQLYSHMRGALQVGCTEEQVETVLEIAGRIVAPTNARAARRVWAKVRQRTGSGRG